MVILKRLLLIAFCVCALCAIAVAQENGEGQIQNCTDPGVLTDDAVNLKAPVELTWATTTRGLAILVTADFRDADGKALLFKLNGPIPSGKDARPYEFTVINKCRVTQNSLEYVQTTNISAGSKEEIALLKFLRSWLEANVPEEMRVSYQHAVKLKEIGEFSGEAQ
jgi:hypothetical protein